MALETLESSSLKIYEDLNWFSRQTQKKRLYLNAIDTFVINESAKQGNYLDVGAGPGLRAMSIAERIQAKNVYLVDNCPTMASEWKALPAQGKHLGTVETLECDLLFDTVTCLWSVLNHTDAPLSLLTAIRDKMKKGGKLFLDQNHRYNVSEYGWRLVLRNQLDHLLKKERAGFYALRDQPQHQVYLYRPTELDSILRRAGFSDFKKVFVHYATGKQTRSSFNGQLLYIVTRT